VRVDADGNESLLGPSERTSEFRAGPACSPPRRWDSGSGGGSESAVSFAAKVVRASERDPAARRGKTKKKKKKKATDGNVAGVRGGASVRPPRPLRERIVSSDPIVYLATSEGPMLSVSDPLDGGLLRQERVLSLSADFVGVFLARPIFHPGSPSDVDKLRRGYELQVAFHASVVARARARPWPLRGVLPKRASLAAGPRPILRPLSEKRGYRVERVTLLSERGGELRAHHHLAYCASRLRMEGLPRRWPSLQLQSLHPSSVPHPHLRHARAGEREVFVSLPVLLPR